MLKISIFSCTPRKKGVILHPYLPITATSLQRPLSSVPNVTVMEKFDCMPAFFVQARSFTEGNIYWSEVTRPCYIHTVLTLAQITQGNLSTLALPHQQIVVIAFYSVILGGQSRLADCTPEYGLLYAKNSADMLNMHPPWWSLWYSRKLILEGCRQKVWNNTSQTHSWFI